jgi:hypothetical protein
MDGTRYMAEKRLIQILEEKHIDDPDNLSIEWKSQEWNVALIVFTIVAAVISGAPLHRSAFAEFPVLVCAFSMDIPPSSGSRQLPCGRLLSVPHSISRHFSHEESHHLHGDEPYVHRRSQIKAQ